MLHRALVFFAVIGVIYAALSLGLPVKNPYNDEEGCFVKEFNHSIPFGEKVPSKKLCMAYRCSTKLIVHESCGSVAVSDDCEVIKRTDKAYPECCIPIIKCSKHDEAEPTTTVISTPIQI